jgi:hypothetical protein
MVAVLDAHRVNPHLKTDPLAFERERGAIFVLSHRRS